MQVQGGDVYLRLRDLRAMKSSNGGNVDGGEDEEWKWGMKAIKAKGVSQWSCSHCFCFSIVYYERVKWLQRLGLFKTTTTTRS